MNLSASAERSRQFYAFNKPIDYYFRYGQDLHLVWKDPKGKFIGCSEVVESETGLSAAMIAGLSDFDLVWANRANEYRVGEERVMQSGKTQCLFEPAKMVQSEVSLLTFKTPLVNAVGHNEGIFGISFTLSPERLASIPLSINELGILAPDPLCFLSVSKYGTQLTQREKECLRYLVRGKTASEIAQILYRSRRTVEDYIENIKMKFGCRKKSELIEKVLGESLFV